ncbi:MAG: hypothetical protein NDJ89_04680 [Oligoflexia bacterium]|nr:hypothetical protein [Oligoflexia bacterium]
MNQEACRTCRKPQPTLQCESCGAALCKSCREAGGPEAFLFYAKLPPELAHTDYCQQCYALHVEPALVIYRELMERARETYFFFETQKRALPVLRRSKELLRVENCGDRDETILRLAFQAVEKGFNSVIEAEVVSEKIRNGGHQTMRWRGKGFPAEMDVERLNARG